MEFHSESQYEVCSKASTVVGMGVDAVVGEIGGVPTLGRLTTNSRHYGLQKALNSFSKGADIPRSFATTASTHISRTSQPFIRAPCTVNRIIGVLGSIFFNLGAASIPHSRHRQVENNEVWR
jgi:zinc transporter ZupT